MVQVVLNKKVNYFFNFQVNFFSQVKEDGLVCLVTAPSNYLSNDLYFFLLWFFNLNSFTVGFSEQDKIQRMCSLENSRYQFSKRYPYTVFYPINQLLSCNSYELYFNFIYFLQVLQDFEKITEISPITNSDTEVVELVFNLRSEVLNIFNFAYFVSIGFNTLVSYSDFQQFAMMVIRTGIHFNSHNLIVLLFLRNLFFAFYAGIKGFVKNDLS